MSRFNKSLAAIFMMTALLLTNAARAMEIRQFDKMAVADQGDYMGLLIAGAEQVLNDEGRSDLAAQVEHLLTTTDAGDRHTIGMVEFELNLALAREADAKRVISDPNAQRLEVEDALAVTLKKNGIDLPQAFFTVANERIRDTKKHIQNPNAPRVQVEVALAETLGKNGIQITPDFIKALMQQTGTFKPKHN